MFLEIAVLHKHGASVAVTARLSYPAVKGTGYSNSHTPLPTFLLFSSLAHVKGLLDSNLHVLLGANKVCGHYHWA